MSDIEKVKKLREATGAGFKDCNLAIKESKGDLDKALEYYNKSLNIRIKLFGENHPDVASTYDNIGLLYKDGLNDKENAKLYLTKARDIYLKLNYEDDVMEINELLNKL